MITRLGKPPQATKKTRWLSRQSTLTLDELCDVMLNGADLCFAISVGSHGEDFVETNADWARISAMLFAVEEGLRIGPCYGHFLHYGKLPPPSPDRDTVVSVRDAVRELRRSGEQFALLWHIAGSGRVHLDCSNGMDFEDAEQRFMDLASE
jgi:hypothetical protein